MASTFTTFILHQFWSCKRNDKTQAARDLLMAISQTKRAGCWFLIPAQGHPPCPRLRDALCQEGHFRVFTEQLLPWLPLTSPLCPCLPCAARQRKASASRIAQDLTVAPFLPFWQGRGGRFFNSMSCMGSGRGKGWKKAAISDNMCHLGACLTLISR